jgi:hypothetical protein
MKALALFATALLLVGCEDTYRYPCQDPANKDKAECNRPDCEADGFCYDKLNGLPEQEAVSVEEAAPAATECNKVEETTGE